MVQSYYKLQQWNNWLAQQPLGQHLLKFEHERLAQLLKESPGNGKQLVLIGVPQQSLLLRSFNVSFHKVLISPFNENSATKVEAFPTHLPILSGSIDMVVLPHTLNFVENPKPLLDEACRIVKPEGLITVCGFNPYSIWGLKKIITNQKKATIPWSGNFITANNVKNWLKLVDFQIENQNNFLFGLPTNNPNTIKKMQWLENVGKLFFPFFGGIYIVVARAKVIPLTPIRLKWKQQLNGIRITPTIRNV